MGETPHSEKAMFGGLAFLVGGHMAVAAGGGGGLLLRCDPVDLPEHAHPTASRRWSCAAAR